jgi:hypothetical protein
MNNPMEEGDGRTLDVMKEPSTKSPISVIEGEETTDKSKASCVEPLVNEPKRIKLEQSGPEAGSQIEQPAPGASLGSQIDQTGPETDSELEQLAPGASLGTKLEQPGSSKIEQPAPVAPPVTGLIKVDEHLKVNVVKGGRRREIYMTDSDGRTLRISCILPKPKPPKFQRDYNPPPLSPVPEGLIIIRMHFLCDPRENLRYLG